jgi:hypothetical protein
MVNHWRYETLEGIDAGGPPQLKQALANGESDDQRYGAGADRASGGCSAAALHRLVRRHQMMQCQPALHPTGVTFDDMTGRVSGVVYVKADQEYFQPADVLRGGDGGSLPIHTASPPAAGAAAGSVQRRLDYVEWARQVVAGLQGANPWLEKQFDEAAKRADLSVQPRV